MRHPESRNNRSDFDRMLERTDLTEHQVEQAQTHWLQNTPIRLIIEDAIAREIETQRNRLESTTTADTPAVQGEIKGLRKALAIIAAKQIR